MSGDEGDKCNVSEVSLTDTLAESSGDEPFEATLETPAPKKLRSEAAPNTSMKEYNVNVVKEEGPDAALKRREEYGGYNVNVTQSLAADDVVQFYKEIIKWQQQGYEAKTNVNVNVKECEGSTCLKKEGPNEATKQP